TLWNCVEAARSLLLQLGVFAVVPDVDVVGRVLDVALLIEGDRTDDRVDRLAALQRLGDFGRIVAAGTLDALGEGLDHRVGEQREAFRYEAALLDGVDRLLGLGAGLGIGR